MIKYFFALHHIHVFDYENNCIKFIGIYSSLAETKNAVNRLSIKPGFSEFPDIINTSSNIKSGFYITTYEVDKDYVNGNCNNYNDYNYINIITTQEIVYIIQFLHIIDDTHEDYRLIGVYSSESTANLAIERLRLLADFNKYSNIINPIVDNDENGFYVDKNVINSDNWADGFVTD